MGFITTGNTKWNKKWNANFIARSGTIPMFGLQAWYDASDESYLALVSTAITQMLDRSGNGNHTAVQGTGTARPTLTTAALNGKSVASFDGGDTLVLPSALYTIANGANTIVTIAKRNTESGATATVVGLGEGVDVNRFSISFNSNAGEVIFRNDAGAGSVVTSTGNTNTSYGVLTGSFNGTTGLSVSVNGATATTSTTGAASSGVDRAYIGSRTGTSLFLTGGIAEILIYNRALSAAEIRQVEVYLANKWGITLA